MVSSGSNLGNVVLELGADASALNRDMARVERDTRQRLDNLGKRARGLGIRFAAAGAVITGALGLAVKSATAFEQSMAQVRAVSGATEAEFQALTAIAKEMGQTTVFTARQSAAALSFMAMAGLSASDSVAALPDVLNLAAAGQLELADAADIVTNVMTGYGIAADDVTRATDVLVTGFTSANTNLQQLGEAFKYAGPVAKAAGIPFEETSAALSLLGNAGLQASMAGTTLRGIVTRLLNPVGKAEEILARLGITATDSAGNLLPLQDILKQFEASGITAGEAMSIFGQRAGPGMLALIGQGSGALAELTGQMENSGGTADRIAKTQLDTFQGQLTLLKSAVEGLANTVGQIFIPELRKMVERLAPIVQNVARWVQENPRLAKTIAVTAGILGVLALALGGVLVTISLLIPAVAALGVTTIVATGGITLAIGLLVAAGVALWQNWDWVVEKANVIWPRMRQAAETAINFIIKAINKLSHVHRHAMAGMIDAAVKVAEVFGIDLPEGVEKFADALRRGIPEVNLYQAAVDDAAQVNKDMAEDAYWAARAQERQSETTGDLTDETNDLTDATDLYNQELADLEDASHDAIRAQEELLAARRAAREDLLSGAGVTEQDVTMGRLLMAGGDAALRQQIMDLAQEEGLSVEVAAAQIASDESLRRENERKAAEERQADAKAAGDRLVELWEDTQERIEESRDDADEDIRDANEDLADFLQKNQEDLTKALGKAEDDYQDRRLDARDKFERSEAKAEEDYQRARQKAQEVFERAAIKAEEDYLRDRQNAREAFERESIADREKYQRDVERAQARHQARLESQRESHLQRLADIRRDAVQAEEDAERARTRSREDIERDYQQGVEDLRRRLSEQFFDTPDADITGILSQVGADTQLLEAHLEGMAELALKRNRELEDTESKHSRKIEDIAIKKARREEEAQERHNTRMAEMDAEFKRQQADAERKYQWDRARADAEFKRQQAEAERKYQWDRARADAEFKRQQAEAEQKYRLERSEAAAEFDRRQAEAAEAHEDKLESIREKHDQAEADARTRHSEAIEKAERAHLQRTADLLNQYQDAEKAELETHGEEMLSIYSSWTRAIANKVRALLAQIAAMQVSIRPPVMVTQSGGDDVVVSAGGGGPKGGVIPSESLKGSKHTSSSLVDAVKEAGFEPTQVSIEGNTESVQEQADNEELGLAKGGIVPARRGGRLVRVAEGGEAEGIIPLSRLPGIIARMQDIQPRVSGEVLADYGVGAGAGDIPLPDFGRGKGEKPQFTVLLSGDLKKLGSFVRAQVLEGDIRGRQEVFYR